MKIACLLSLCILLFMILGCAVQKVDDYSSEGYEDSTVDNSAIQGDSQNEIEAFLKSEPNLTEFKLKFPHQDVLKHDNSYYSIIETDTYPIFVCFMEDQSFEMYLILNFSQGINSEAIKTVKPGESYTSIREMDPNGAYPFLYAGFSQVPKFSYHYAIDEGLYMVYYDENNVVKKIDLYFLN